MNNIMFFLLVSLIVWLSYVLGKRKAEKNMNSLGGALKYAIFLELLIGGFVNGDIDINGKIQLYPLDLEDEDNGSTESDEEEKS